MAWTYEDVIPSLIPNTTMQKKFLDGVHKVYVIAPCEGYVLHDAENDARIDEGTEDEIFITRYVSGMTTCGASYDFTPAVFTDEHGVEHTAYGSRAFFARLASEVDASQIFGNVDNDHEVM